MQRTARRLRGFVRVRSLCPYPERFINICAQNGVLFWGVKRIGDHEIEAVLDARSYPKAAELAERSGCELHVEEKRGMPFFLGRFRRRYALLIGLFLCVFGLMYSNQFIWEFQVEGNEHISDDEILQALEEIGVGIGSKAGAIDIADIQNRLLPRLGALSWITVNARGSIAQVIVRERTEKPYIVPLKSPANIIAGKAGLIVSIDTLAGSPKVFAGQMVQEGQLLVSGLLDSQKVGVRFVHARADVIARTWYDIQAVIPTEAVGKRYTGKSSSRSALVIAGYRVNLYQDSSQNYAYYDKIVETNVLRLPTGTALPLTLVTETYVEYEPAAYTLSGAVAESMLKKALESALEAQAGQGEIAAQSIEYQSGGGVVTAHLTAECLEKIDVQTEIPLLEQSAKNPYLPDWILN